MFKKFFSIMCLVVSGIIMFLPEVVVGATCTTIVNPGLVVNETWTLAGSPYCVTGDIQVSLLAIEPCVEVLVDGPFKIEVLSTITAIGTEECPILFSAKEPLEPENQRWKGIKFQNTPPGSEFIHTIIEYSDDSGITLTNAVPPVIDNCTIRNNSKVGHGGGIQAVLSTGQTLSLKDCIFENNTANPLYATGEYMGGALYLGEGNLIIKNSEFTGNLSNSKCYGRWDGCGVTGRGGAIYIGGTGNVTIENSNIRENQTDATSDDYCFVGMYARSYGAGVFVNGGTVTLANSTLSGNITTTRLCVGPEDGGGLFVNGGSVMVVNSTIARNPDSTGVHLDSGTLDILNSIIYFNNNDGTQVGGAPTITYSDVQGGYDGEGNISYNPVFAGLGNTYCDLRIVLGSPAIDAGNPDPIYYDECRPPGLGTERNDMGVTGGPRNCEYPVPLLGDIDKDCDVDISDVILVLRMALDLDEDVPCADIDVNGVVDISDVILTLRMALGLDELERCFEPG